MTPLVTQFQNRATEYPLRQEMLSRTSSRAFSKERISEEELMSLFEAAKWAPSSYNSQPWRFIYGRKGEPEWALLFDLLVEFNQSWCKEADTLILIISKNNFEHNNKPAPTSRFDTGAAWMSLALEAHSKNIVAHGMQGFDYEAAKKKFQIPEGFTVEAMAALGKAGKKEDLSAELQEKETPTTRKSVKEIISKGKFNFK